MPAKSDVTLKSNVSLDVSAEKELKDTADMQIKQSDPPQVSSLSLCGVKKYIINLSRCLSVTLSLPVVLLSASLLKPDTLTKCSQPVGA